MKLTTTCCALSVLAALTSTPILAKTAEDFQTWGNITATGSLDILNPDLKSFSQVTDVQKEQLDKSLATVLQRILVEQCSSQTKAVIAAEGVQAVGDSFQELGKITGEEILENPEVKSQLKGVLRYVDLNKMVMTFLTPDIWNKLGVIR